MDQTLSSLNLTTDTYKELKSLGFSHLKDVTDSVINKKFSAEEWKYLTQTPSTKTALDLYQENSFVGTVYTFNQDFDNILEGELDPGNILELCGESGSGKTQICFQLCVTVQLPMWCGGRAGEAVYICTNSSFSSRRLKEIASSMVEKYSSLKESMIGITSKEVQDNFNIEHILKSVHHFKIMTYDELYASVIYLKKWLMSHQKVRLVVIDSITAPLQQVDYKERRHITYRILGKLQELAVEYNFVILITNNMTTRIKSSDIAYITPSLGESYYHRINSRILLKRITPTQFQASIVKSVCKPNTSVNFQFYM